MSGTIDEWAETNHFDNTICPLECCGKDDIELLKLKIDKEIDELKMKKVKDFGISMAGQYRNQGMLEYCKELKQTLLTGSDSRGKKE